jgi:hypothetical protein
LTFFDTETPDIAFRGFHRQDRIAGKAAPSGPAPTQDAAQ